MSPRALIVDDDPGVRFTLREFLEDLEVEVAEATDVPSALKAHRKRPADVVVLDLRMPGDSGLEFLRSAPLDACRVIVLTAHGSEREAVAAMKLGAADYLTKPFDPDGLRRVIERVLAPVRLGERAEALEGELNLARSMVFASAPMRELGRRILRIAPKDVTVLIRGESGTGKERVAEAIVRASSRAQRSFVRFNCAALSTELVEAELFGHVAGAFTGASQDRTGLFREADRGTILLDEIGELDERVQVKLLRVIQEKQVRPVGSDVEVEVDVRILASTHQDLEAKVHGGSFREDLMYRLKVVELLVPPLRERPEDVRPLAEHFLRLHGDRFGVRIPPNPALFERLLEHDWPGNVRELEHAIESLLALSDGRTLDLDLLPRTSTEPDEGPARAGLKERVQAFERGVLVATLESTRGNRTEAARRLGIGRATLHEKLQKHGIR